MIMCLTFITVEQKTLIRCIMFRESAIEMQMYVFTFLLWVICLQIRNNNTVNWPISFLGLSNSHVAFRFILHWTIRLFLANSKQTEVLNRILISRGCLKESLIYTIGLIGPHLDFHFPIQNSYLNPISFLE